MRIIKPQAVFDESEIVSSFMLALKPALIHTGNCGIYWVRYFRDHYFNYLPYINNHQRTLRVE
jgi:hypothetical protein